MSLGQVSVLALIVLEAAIFVHVNSCTNAVNALLLGIVLCFVGHLYLRLDLLGKRVLGHPNNMPGKSSMEEQRCSPIGLVPKNKPNSSRLIHQLSFLKGVQLMTSLIEHSVKFTMLHLTQGR